MSRNIRPISVSVLGPSYCLFAVNSLYNSDNSSLIAAIVDNFWISGGSESFSAFLQSSTFSISPLTSKSISD